MKCYNLSINDNLFNTDDDLTIFIHVCHKQIAKYSAVVIVPTKVAKTHPLWLSVPMSHMFTIMSTFKVFVEKVMKIIKMSTYE